MIKTLHILGNQDLPTHINDNAEPSAADSKSISTCIFKNINSMTILGEALRYAGRLSDLKHLLEYK